MMIRGQELMGPYEHQDEDKIHEDEDKIREEEVVAVDIQIFEDIKGKEIRLRFTTEILEEMAKEIKSARTNEEDRTMGD